MGVYSCSWKSIASALRSNKYLEAMWHCCDFFFYRNGDELPCKRITKGRLNCFFFLLNSTSPTTANVICRKKIYIFKELCTYAEIDKPTDQTIRIIFSRTFAKVNNSTIGRWLAPTVCYYHPKWITNQNTPINRPTNQQLTNLKTSLAYTDFSSYYCRIVFMCSSCWLQLVIWCQFIGQ